MSVRTYVKVNSDFDATGYMQPRSITWQDGRTFFGPSHIRMNLALPRSRMDEAFRRLKEQVFAD